jgi:hypothetical protein
MKKARAEGANLKEWTRQYPWVMAGAATAVDAVSRKATSRPGTACGRSRRRSSVSREAPSTAMRSDVAAGASRSRAPTSTNAGKNETTLVITSTVVQP